MDNYIILNNTRVPVPFECLNWENAPSQVKRHTQVNRRIKDCRFLVVHTVHGRTCRHLAPGGKASTRDLMWARSHYNSPRKASTDAYLDTDGSMTWCNDPMTHYTWGAGAVNPYAMHVELVTDEDGQLYEATLESLTSFVMITLPRMGIQIQTPWNNETDTPYSGRLIDCDPERAGRRTVGVIGHRNIWTHPPLIDPATGKARIGPNGKPLKDLTRYVPQRGFGDPNDLPFEWLAKHTPIEKVEFHKTGSQRKSAVETLWETRQTGLGVTADGLPLKETVGALKAAGFKQGIFALGR